MGQIVSELSDIAVITSDNPRSEKPEKIIEEILAGIPSRSARAGFYSVSEVNRARAIKRGISLAQSGDVVLIAGKGHEDYQEINGKKFPFSDLAQANAIIQELWPVERRVA